MEFYRIFSTIIRLTFVIACLLQTIFFDLHLLDAIGSHRKKNRHFCGQIEFICDKRIGFELISVNRSENKIKSGLKDSWQQHNETISHVVNYLHAIVITVIYMKVSSTM